jgi:hypothetical protein
MSKVAIPIVVVLGLLALGYPKRNLVIAETQQIASILGYELQLNLKVELVKARALETNQAEDAACAIVSDTLEAP